MKKIQSKAAKLGVAVISAVMAAFIVVASTGIPAAHAQISTNAQALAGLIAVDNLAVVSGAMPPEALGSLIVLNGLFPTSSNTIQNTKNLAGLIAVDAVTGGAANPTQLSSLIVLNGLFNDP